MKVKVLKKVSKLIELNGTIPVDSSLTNQNFTGQKNERQHLQTTRQATFLRRFVRRHREQESSDVPHCFFCDKKAKAGESLRKAATLELDFRVRTCPQRLQDESLLAKLSSGDMVAQKAQYQSKCLVSLYNRMRETETHINTDEELINHGIAFAELVSYIEDVQNDNIVAPVLYLADLISLYTKRLEQLGTSLSGRVHSTRLKNKILCYFPEMEAHSQGNKVILVFKDHIGTALRQMCDVYADSDAAHLARAAKIVRKDILKMKLAALKALCTLLIGSGWTAALGKAKVASPGTAESFLPASHVTPHEQNNALVKGDCGAVGLTDNPAAFHRWMVSGPQMARPIKEFENSTDK
ncbi:Hypothetical predicted protein [Paramuricea clavata]|uniref:Uncharacterized protein n=1 Tax=Paramuricea clavata TaxID=317549 RepID=A0A6S7K9W0_PARCT|nr:Hypothetical predicted protein [Paramuricea clavata]